MPTSIEQITPQYIAKNPLALAKLLGYTKVTHSIHEEWIKDLWRPGDSSIQAHRNSYKTTCSVIGIIWGLLFKPETTMWLIRKSYDEAKSILDEIKQHYERPALRALYKHLFDIDEPRNLSKWSSEGISLATKEQVTKERNIEISGVGTYRTGSHFDMILCDDIVTLKDRIFKRERENTKVYVKELANILKADGIGIKYRGTPWHKDDAWRDLPEPRRWPVSKNFIPDLTPERLEHIKGKLKASLYAANYDLIHIASEDRIFGEPTFGSHPQDLPYIGVLDPAYSGENNTSLVIGAYKNEKIYAIGFTWPDSVVDCYGAIVAKMNQYRAGTLYIESNADKGFSARDLQELYRGPVEEYHEKENKHIRIMANAVGHWDKLVFHEDTDDDFMSNLLDYQEGQEPDDEPDALAGMIRQFVEFMGPPVEDLLDFQRML